jgi:hypothetical protein
MRKRKNCLRESLKVKSRKKQMKQMKQMKQLRRNNPPKMQDY